MILLLLPENSVEQTSQPEFRIRIIDKLPEIK
jgi:hypothetical protein